MFTKIWQHYRKKILMSRSIPLSHRWLQCTRIHLRIWRERRRVLLCTVQCDVWWFPRQRCHCTNLHSTTVWKIYVTSSWTGLHWQNKWQRFHFRTRDLWTSRCHWPILCPLQPPRIPRARDFASSGNEGLSNSSGYVHKATTYNQTWLSTRFSRLAGNQDVAIIIDARIEQKTPLPSALQADIMR